MNTFPKLNTNLLYSGLRPWDRGGGDPGAQLRCCCGWMLAHVHTTAVLLDIEYWISNMYFLEK